MREDDEFYKAYMDMQANAKFATPKHGTDRRWESERKGRDTLTTSRFGDSEKGTLVIDDVSSVITEEQFWYERRNRFLDLN